MNRINISSEKKQIPQSSELEFVRGRVVQDIVCRLCHQKLGGLVHLETECVPSAFCDGLGVFELIRAERRYSGNYPKCPLEKSSQ
jgi:hypothetical protein